jgi:hypothetical protein
MLVRNFNSTIPQAYFFSKSTTSSPQLEGDTSAIFQIWYSIVIFIDGHDCWSGIVDYCRQAKGAEMQAGNQMADREAGRQADRQLGIITDW